jgi:hypothetical protein
MTQNISEERARAGHTGDGVRYVLIISTALAASLLSAIAALWGA